MKNPKIQIPFNMTAQKMYQICFFGYRFNSFFQVFSQLLKKSVQFNLVIHNFLKIIDHLPYVYGIHQSVMGMD